MYQSGEVLEYICPVCDEAPVTQIENIIEFDANRYDIFIPPIKEYGRDMIKIVADICSCNFLQAKAILEDTGYKFSNMDAIETKRLKSLIDSKGIEYEISPRFRW